MSNIYKEVLEQILFLYKGYSKEHRASTQPFHLEKVKELVPDYKYDTQDLLVREPLIEHSGSLPMVATMLYPHLDTDNVDLGRALTMLAVHDIGELVTGDEITFTKQSSKAIDERKHALNLLPVYLHDIYLEMEERRSDTARFAKSVDKITPDILDILTPAEITIQRYKEFVKKEPKDIVPMIKQFKHPYMIWNKFLTRFHLEVLNRISRKIQSYY